VLPVHEWTISWIIISKDELSFVIISGETIESIGCSIPSVAKPGGETRIY
jgi:hypothetical protein